MKLTSLSLLLLAFTACPPPPGLRYVSDPLRYKGLPADPEKLVALADELMARRPAEPRQTDRALAALELALDHKATAQRYDLLWRAARASCLMSEGIENKDQALTYAQQGRDYAEQAIKVEGKRIEGLYYYAICIGRMVDAHHKLKMLKPLIAAAEAAVKVNPAFDNAGALCLMGKVYITAPAWPVSIGSPEKAVDLLERALKIAPQPMARIFLGQAYYHDEQYAKAKEQIERGLREATADLLPRWRKEAEDYLRRISKRTKP
jgi:tetratricopeptide (TPR) repeat protein